MTTPSGKFPTRITEHQVHHHASETARSTNPAGGQLPTQQYENRTPRPAGTPSESLPFKHRNDR
jgi:hypothetical protein